MTGESGESANKVKKRSEKNRAAADIARSPWLPFLFCARRIRRKQRLARTNCSAQVVIQVAGTFCHPVSGPDLEYLEPRVGVEPTTCRLRNEQFCCISLVLRIRHSLPFAPFRFL